MKFVTKKMWSAYFSPVSTKYEEYDLSNKYHLSDTFIITRHVNVMLNLKKKENPLQMTFDKWFIFKKDLNTQKIHIHVVTFKVFTYFGLVYIWWLVFNL